MSIAEDKKIKCSFCEADEKANMLIISGPKANICEICIQKAMDILLTEHRKFRMEINKLPEKLTKEKEQNV